MADSKNTTSHKTEQEIWKPIPGFPGYEASNLGMVRSWRNTPRGRRTDPYIISQFKTNDAGYISVTLQQNGKAKRKYIHSLILLSFVGEKPHNMVCCHLDDNPKNNRLDNIKWDTQKNNIKQAVDNGNIAHGERHPCTFITEEEVVSIRELISSGEKSSVVAKKFNISRLLVNRIASGSSWKYAAGPVFKRDSTKGANNGLAKLNDAQVKEIKIRFNKGESSYKLSLEFGISSSVILRICRGETWKHIEGPITKHHKQEAQNHKAAKLTNAVVVDLRVRYANGESTKILAEELGISTSTVKRICNGTAWASVGGPITKNRKSII